VILYARAMPSPAEIKQRIEAAIPGARAEVEDYTGGGDHFRATVTAVAFEGRSRIDQHRLVYEVFGGEIGGPIHALSLKTQTSQQAAAPQPTPTQ
jgi:stress-induced morphogen